VRRCYRRLHLLQQRCVETERFLAGAAARRDIAVILQPVGAAADALPGPFSGGRVGASVQLAPVWTHLGGPRLPATADVAPADNLDRHDRDPVPRLKGSASPTNHVGAMSRAVLPR
jgi:hypothetical protein